MQRLEEVGQGAAKPSLLNTGSQEETGGASILASLEQGKGGSGSRSILSKRRLPFTTYGAGACIALAFAGWLFYSQSSNPHAASAQVVSTTGLAVDSPTSSPILKETITIIGAPSATLQPQVATIVSEAPLPQAEAKATITVGADTASGSPKADSVPPLPASLEEGALTPVSAVSERSEAKSLKSLHRGPVASHSKKGDEGKKNLKKDRKEEQGKRRDSRGDKTKKTLASVKSERERKTALDGDVVLLSALVAHTADPVATKSVAKHKGIAKPNAREANGAKRTELARASDDAPNLDIVERNHGDTTQGLLQRCKKLGLLEGELCRLRICSGKWESDAACRVQEPS